MDEKVKMKPFDIEAARRGETILLYPHGPENTGYRVKLIGQDSSGRIFVESVSHGTEITQPYNLYMHNTQMVWVNLYRQHDGEIVPMLYTNEEIAHAKRKDSGNCIGCFEMEVPLVSQ